MKKRLLTFSMMFLSLILAACNSTSRNEYSSGGMAMNSEYRTNDTVTAEMNDTQAMPAEKKTVVAITKKKTLTAKKKTHITYVAKAKKTLPPPTPDANQTAMTTPARETAGTPVVTRKILAKSQVIEYQDQKYCQKYRATTVVNGVTTKSYGIACKQPSGKWRIMT